jgi:hypothetical protein
LEVLDMINQAWGKYDSIYWILNILVYYCTR